ncbi:MAG: ImmA/IrrE family metallo-endopeptidase [Ethanoligenens sp.]|uniref:ImmA/IrrE family metallo-endopeptidase n=1 Tax=Ethanoligenens sp. TaxID=2099655 RepID=UPI0039E911A1
MDMLDELYQDAAENHIPVFGCPLADAKSIIADLGDGTAAIGLNVQKIEGRQEAVELFAHELGHYHTGTYYKLYSPLQLKCKMEYKADIWTVERLIPINRLKRAFRENCQECWELAEYLGCSERLVLRAVQIYRQKGLLD